MTRELPSFLRDTLAAPPRAGEGVHAWLFRVARQLHAHLPAGEIVGFVAAVQDAFAVAWRADGERAS